MLVLVPGEEGATITSIFSGATGLRMGFPIRLNSILLGALVTLPLLLTVFARVVFLNPCEVSKSP